MRRDKKKPSDSLETRQLKMLAYFIVMVVSVTSVLFFTGGLRAPTFVNMIKSMTFSTTVTLLLLRLSHNKALVFWLSGLRGRLFNSFLWFLSKKDRRIIEQVRGDVKRDVKELKKQKRSPFFILFFTFWHIGWTLFSILVSKISPFGLLLKLIGK